MIVRRALTSDLNRINEIYDNLFDYEDITGSSTNWERGVYPSLKNAEEKLALDQLFVAVVEGEVVGSLVLNNEQLPEYEKFQWLYEAEDEEVGVIHTLCMDPNYFGKGYASEIVKFSEEYFKEQGCKVMRFDTYEHNMAATNMYVKLGYRISGVEEFFFQGFIRENLRCFEKKL